MRLIILLISCTTWLTSFAQSGEWTSYRDMPSRRQELPAELLNGKIYVPGGIVLASTNKMEVYDPETNAWSLASPMPDARHHHMMTAVHEKLIVIGGHKNVLDFDAKSNVWEYDPVSNTWSVLSSIPIPVGSGTAVTYNDMVYVLGGTNDTSVLDINFRYDPSTDTWEQLTGMPTPREHLAAAVIDTLIYVVGGRGAWGAGISLEAYSPSTDTWEVKATMPTDRSGLAAAELHGKLYAFGGEGGGIHNETEEYDPATDSWRSMQPMRTPRHGIDAVKLGDEVFIPGGAWLEGFGPSNKMESFKVEALVTGISELKSIHDHSAFVHQDQRVSISFLIMKNEVAEILIYSSNGSVVAEYPPSLYDSGKHIVHLPHSLNSDGVYYYAIRSQNSLVSGSFVVH